MFNLRPIDKLIKELRNKYFINNDTLYTPIEAYKNIIKDYNIKEVYTNTENVELKYEKTNNTHQWIMYIPFDSSLVYTLVLKYSQLAKLFIRQDVSLIESGYFGCNLMLPNDELVCIAKKLNYDCTKISDYFGIPVSIIETKMILNKLK